ncbi:MAG: hypothetical protein CME20_25525 [Gemmatimonadetes bacterium]|nr:hypothetical protein [Gemmatimonadota bacterium]
MLLTLSTTHQPATDLGYLLHKHPDRTRHWHGASVLPGGAGTARVRAGPGGAGTLCRRRAAAPGARMRLRPPGAGERTGRSPALTFVAALGQGGDRFFHAVRGQGEHAVGLVVVG